MSAGSERTGYERGRKLSVDGAFEAIVPNLEGDPYAQGALDRLSDELARVGAELERRGKQADCSSGGQPEGSHHSNPYLRGEVVGGQEEGNEL